MNDFSVGQWLAAQFNPNWETVRFNRVFIPSDERNGDNPVGIPLSISGEKGVIPRNHEVGQKTSEDVSDYRIVRPGQLAANMMWLNYGGLGISDYLGYVSPVYQAFNVAPQMNKRFAHHLLRSRVFTTAFQLLGRGVRPNSQMVPSIEMAALPVPLLSDEEQNAIADFLDRETSQIDAMIEAQENLINTLEERRDSVLPNVLFADQDLDDEPAAWYGASQWDAPKLWRHAKITNGSTPRRAREDYWGGDFPWLNSSVVNLDTVTDADQFVTETALKECHLPVLPAGSILVGLTGQGKTRGKATELQIEATINQHIAAVIPDVNYWNSRFLTLALRSAYDELRRISDANGATKGALTCEALSAFRIPLPPLKEQESLAEKADKTTSRTNDLIAAAHDVITLLRERREALITAAVTGRIDPHTGIERIDHLDYVNNATFVNV